MRQRMRNHDIPHNAFVSQSSATSIYDAVPQRSIVALPLCINSVERVHTMFIIHLCMYTSHIRSFSDVSDFVTGKCLLYGKCSSA